MQGLLDINRGFFRLATKIFFAALLSLALLSHVVPLATASTAQLCTMACCKGKAANASSSCSHALAEPEKKFAAEPEVLCGLKVAANEAAPETSEAGSEADDAEACALHGASADASNSSATSNSNSPDPSRVVAHALITPCGPDCSACSGSNTIRPRPRELATLSSAVKPRPPASTKADKTHYCQFTVRDATRTKLQPRGPPVSFI